MKTWLFSILLLVLLCTFIKALKIKHRKSKAKQQDCKNQTLADKHQGESNNKLKCQPVGQFSLKWPTKSKHINDHRTAKQIKKNSSEKILKLLQDLRKCMAIKHKDVKCQKGKKNAKKAMIWPKKMLPTLEKMLLNKINGGGNGNFPGDNNGDNGFENYDNPSDNSDENTFSPTTSSSSFGKNDFSDNWDSVNPRHHKAKFHGMDVVPLLKMLKEKVGDTSPFDSNAFTGMPSNQGGSKYLTKLLLSQALGKPDRGAIMKDMMQEFFLANGNERSGEEAREAFNELVGHNNLVAYNSQMEAENSDVNVGGGSPQGMSGLEGRQGMSERIPSFGSQPGLLQTQELPNGQIAPLNQQTMGQRMIASRPAMQEVMAQTANPTTRMLNHEPNVPNVPSMPNVPNIANMPILPNVVNNDGQGQLAARIVAEQNAQSRPVPFAESNDLVFEEQGESAARGIRPPPFQAQRANEAERVMKLQANYQSSPIRESQRYEAPIMSSIPQRDEMAIRDGEPNVMGMQSERIGDEVAAYFPNYSQQELAARRDALPSRHKHKTTTKAPMRSKGLPASPKAKNKTSKA